MSPPRDYKNRSPKFKNERVLNSPLVRVKKDLFSSQASQDSAAAAEENAPSPSNYLYWKTSSCPEQGGGGGEKREREAVWNQESYDDRRYEEIPEISRDPSPYYSPYPSISPISLQQVSSVTEVEHRRRHRSISPTSTSSSGAAATAPLPAPAPKRRSVFERLSWPTTGHGTSWQIQSQPSPSGGAVVPACTPSQSQVPAPHVYTPPMEIPCSSSIIRRLTLNKQGDSMPSKYDMVAQKEIAILQRRQFCYTLNPPTVVTGDGHGINDFFVSPTGTGVSLHKRFA